MRTILCTVGTSIAAGCAELVRFQREGSDWADDAQRLRSEIASRLERFHLSEAAGRTPASAELNSLNRLGLCEGDEVILLATDTADGRACAETLSLVLTKHWVGLRVTVERVEGLQVRDAKRLREIGLTRLMQVVLRYVEDPQRKHGGGLVINPTGGFKGVVPFLTVVGMIFRVPTVYVFEFSDALIHLPPLPINFDLQLFQRARPALAEMRREGVMPEARFFSLVRAFMPEERSLFQSLLESDGINATLSPLALTIAELEAAVGTVLWISPQVQKMLAGTLGEERKRLEAVLTRFANPLWRASQAHSFGECELPVFGNSRLMFRIAAIFQNGCAYVCRLYSQHDDYERGLSGLKIGDFSSFENFQRWTPPVTEDDLDRAETSELELLRKQVASLPAAIAEATKPLLEELERFRKSDRQKADRIRQLVAENSNEQRASPETHQRDRVPTLPKFSAEASKPRGLEREFRETESDSAPAILLNALVDATVNSVPDQSDGKEVMAFTFSAFGRAFAGYLPIAESHRLAPLPIGDKVRLRVIGIHGPRLALAVP